MENNDNNNNNNSSRSDGVMVNSDKIGRIGDREQGTGDRGLVWSGLL